MNLLYLRNKEIFLPQQYTSDSSGVPDLSLNEDNKAGNILNRYFVSVSPATDDKNDNALVFTGVAVSYKEKKHDKIKSYNSIFSLLYQNRI